MKTYRILSVVFIIICMGLLVGLFAVGDYPPTQKAVFAVCLCAVMVLMALNLVAINKKEKEKDR